MVPSYRGRYLHFILEDSVWIKEKPLTGHYYKRVNRSRTNRILLSFFSFLIHLHIYSCFITMSDKYVRCYCSECKENTQGYNVLTKRTYQEHDRIEKSKKIKETCKYLILNIKSKANRINFILFCLGEVELSQQPSPVDVNDEVDCVDHGKS